MLRRLSILFLSFILFAVTAQARDDAKHSGYGVEANLCFGRIIPNDIVFPPIPALSSALDLAFVQQTNGRRDWQRRRRFPLIGLGLFYANYGNNKIFGQSIGLYPFLQIPLARGKKLEWTC